MVWQEMTVVQQRVASCRLMAEGTVTMTEACRRFGISR